MPVHRPADPLGVALDVTPHGEAEGVGVGVGVPQLRQRNPKLGRPAERVDGGGHFPDAVPRVVLVIVVVDGVIAFHAGGVDGELKAGAPVVVGVDHDFELVGRRAHVAAREDF